MKREHWTIHERKRPEPRVVGVVVRKDKEFVWLQVGKEEKRVAVKDADKVPVGAGVVFTTTGMYGVAKRPGVFVESGTIQLLSEGESGALSKAAEVHIDAKEVLVAEEPDEQDARVTPEPSPAAQAWIDGVFGGGSPEEADTNSGPTNVTAEVEVDVDAAPDRVLESTPGEKKEADPPEHTLLIDFDGEMPIFYVRIKEFDVRIPLQDVKAFYLLPGDKISIKKRNRGFAEVAEVAYATSPYIAGFIEKNDKSGRFQFAVRCPGVSGALRKHLMSANFEGAEEAYKDRRIILFDRVNRTIVDHPEFHQGSSSYERLKRVVLTNMGVYEYNKASDTDREEQEDELSRLLNNHGVKEEGDRATLDERLEPALSQMADEEAARGEILDLRDSKGGKRQTFYIDPHGSKDHDDALSIEDIQKEKGEGWFEIGIHIADVARYMKPGSAIERMAAFRGSSIYLDDETIRMLPSLISEHLASLNANQTRFAFSLLFEVRKDEAKHVRIENIRFAKTAIKVTEGLTYGQAERRIENKNRNDEGTLALRDLMDFAQRLRARKGTRIVGQDYNPEDMDVHEMVAEFMQVKNRASGAAYERLKTGSREQVNFVSDKTGIEVAVPAQPNLRQVQDLILGVYRTESVSNNEDEQEYIRARVEEGKKGTIATPRTWSQWASKPREQKEKERPPTHIEVLLALGILETRDLVAPNDRPVAFVRLVRLARSRVASGGFVVRENGAIRHIRFSDKVTESYFRDARRLRRSGAGYSTKGGMHISMGIEDYTRVTSPIRREADSRGQRKLEFALMLAALGEKLRKEGKDLGEDEARELALRYAREVAGAELTANVREEKDLAKLIKAIGVAAGEEDAIALAHDVKREKLASKAEGVVGSLHTVLNIYEFLYGDEVPETDEEKARREERGLPKPFHVEWARGQEPREYKRPYSISRPYQTREGHMEPGGLIVSFPSGETRVDKDGYIYGEVRISRKNNQVLRRFLPERLQEQGATLQVKIKLPPGFEHPVSWCERNGMDEYRLKIPGKIVAAGPEQGRIEYEIKSGIKQKDAYIDMRQEAIEARRQAQGFPQRPRRR